MLLAEWGLAGIDDGAPDRVRATRELLADPAWAAARRTARGLARRGGAAGRRDARAAVAALTAAGARARPPKA